ncbi:MAG TPA: heme o synthase [Rectinemataceae bacterium]|nr:heme o synthase [Rectinemataceae bacterium]
MGRKLSLRELSSLFKPGIVASNSLTAITGLTLARATLYRTAVTTVDARLLVVGIGVALLVAGAAAVNNGLDHKLDADMARTRGRPTATGRVSPAAAETIGACLAVLGLGLLASLHPLSALLGMAGLLTYIFPYTLWTKRRSSLSSAVGGVAGAIPPLIGWSASDPGLGGPALALFLFLVVWQQAHVWALALRREGEYRSAGLPIGGLGAASGGGLTRRSRIGILAWIAVAQVPLVASLPSLSKAIGIPFLAASLGGGAAWFVAGFLSSRPLRSPEPARWGSAMFFASLAHLLLVFVSLLVLSLAAG